jgi:hypothetical protein
MAPRKQFLILVLFVGLGALSLLKQGEGRRRVQQQHPADVVLQSRADIRTEETYKHLDFNVSWRLGSMLHMITIFCDFPQFSAKK